MIPWTHPSRAHNPNGISIGSAVSPAKTAEPIDMSFGLCARMGPRNHVLDGFQIHPCEGAILRGERAARCKVQGRSGVSCAKTTEPMRPKNTSC